MAESLNVNRNTTLQQLNDFARTVDDQSRLRARRNDDGSITLYVKTGKPSFFSKISPGAIAHRKAAREAVRMVFDNTDRTGKGGFAISQSVRQALDTGMRNDMKGLSLKLLVESGQPTKSRELGPSIDECFMFRDRMPGFIQRLQDNVGDKDQIQQIAKEMGDAIAQGYLARNPKGGEDLALSMGHGMKYELRDMISRHVDMSQLGEGFLDTVYNQAGKQMLPNHQIEGTDRIIINGFEYTPGAKLGEGAYGTVQLYESLDGPPIALKLAKTTGLKPEEIQKGNEGMIKEIHSHRTAFGEGHPGIVNIEGVIRMPDGAIGIALECMPKGTLYEAMQRITEQVKAGNLSETSARAITMTLVKDTMEGLQHMQSLGVSHFDFKAPNVMIDSEGRAKVTDFGQTTQMEGFDFTSYDKPDNPLWLAPEVLIDNTHLRAVHGNYGTKTEEMVQTKQKLVDRFKDLDGIYVNSLIGDIGNRRAKEELQSHTFHTNQKSDVWALGVTAFNLIYGRDLDSNSFLSGVEKTLKTFGSNPGNKFVDTTKLDTGEKWLETDGTRRGPPPQDKPGEKGDIIGISYAGSSGSPEVDDLLNKLLAPLPDQRPELDQLTDHPAFQVKGAGTDEVRDLIKALFGKNPDLGKVKQLSGRIDGMEA